MPAARSLVFQCLALAATAPCGAELATRHEAPSCVVAEAFFRVSAVIAPAGQAVRARVLFRSEAGGGDAAGAGWWAVPMTREGDGFTALLPRPRISAGSVRYRIEVTDDSATVFVDEEHVLEVVAAADACGGGQMAETVASARVLVEVPPGAPLVPPVPQGFSPVGAEAIGGSAGAAGKGGHKGLLLALVGVGAAGAAASQLLGGEGEARPGPQLDVTLKFSSPPSGSTISVSREEFVLVLGLVIPDSPPVVTVRARVYSSMAASLTCGTLGVTFNAPVGTAYDVVLRGFESVSACGAVDRVQVSVEDDRGRVIVATGTPGRPDFVVSYVFAP
jgi:hypothetical protein